jgi:PhoPQ-activated pathogenicity-related protein
MKKKIIMRSVMALLIVYVVYSIIIYLMYSYKLLSNSAKFEGLISNLKVYRHQADGNPLS